MASKLSRLRTAKMASTSVKAMVYCSCCRVSTSKQEMVQDAGKNSSVGTHVGRRMVPIIRQLEVSGPNGVHQLQNGVFTAISCAVFRHSKSMGRNEGFPSLVQREDPLSW